MNPSQSTIGGLARQLSKLGLAPMEQFPLSRYTTLGIGGPAALAVELPGVRLLGPVLEAAGELGVPVIVVGGGSNSLFMDEGFPGLVARLFRGEGKAEVQGQEVLVQADVLLTRLLKTAVSHGVGGFEGLAGIPGVVGGALVNNAGAYQANISDHLLSVTVAAPGGRLVTLGKQDLLFGYRTSTFRKERLPIVEARFAFVPTEEPAVLEERMRSIQLVRRGKFLGIRANAGSTFKNPDGASAGKLLDTLKLKGFQVGQARMSITHANVMENVGGATAKDALTLLDEVERRVLEESGIHLERELEIHGQDTASGFKHVSA